MLLLILLLRLTQITLNELPTGISDVEEYLLSGIESTCIQWLEDIDVG